MVVFGWVRVGFSVLFFLLNCFWNFLLQIMSVVSKFCLVREPEPKSIILNSLLQIDFKGQIQKCFLDSIKKKKRKERILQTPLNKRTETLNVFK